MLQNKSWSGNYYVYFSFVDYILTFLSFLFALYLGFPFENPYFCFFWPVSLLCACLHLYNLRAVSPSCLALIETRNSNGPIEYAQLNRKWFHPPRAWAKTQLGGVLRRHKETLPLACFLLDSSCLFISMLHSAPPLNLLLPLRCTLGIPERMWW